jgi:hypothetical protein
MGIFPKIGSGDLGIFPWVHNIFLQQGIKNLGGGVGLGNMFLVTRGPEYAKYSFNQGSFEDLGSSSSSHANSINFLS